MNTQTTTKKTRSTSWYIKAICLFFSLSLLAACPISATYFHFWKDIIPGWTRILFSPCPLVTDYFELGNIASAFLNAGVRIVLADKREGQEKEDDLCYEGGIVSFVEYLNNEKRGTPIHKDVIYMKGEKNDSIAEVALQYNDSYNELIISFFTDECIFLIG